MCQHPPLRQFFIRVDPHIPIPLVRDCFQHALQHQTPTDNISQLRRRLTSSSTKFVHGAPLNFKSVINQAKTARSFNKDQLLAWYDDQQSTENCDHCIYAASEWQCTRHNNFAAGRRWYINQVAIGGR